ncbi:XRE family transcriptional regulator, partial [Listeria monocytogenes]|nr:XRE family transcriptional regulator [Listeria monocytogenes]
VIDQIQKSPKQKQLTSIAQEIVNLSEP